MKRLWPRSMTGQTMLALALALLFVQGFGAFLVFQAQKERRQAIFVHSAAFRIADAQRSGHGFGPPERFGQPASRGFRIERSPVSPLRPGEVRDAAAETMLKDMLADQGMSAGTVVVLHRKVGDDAISRMRALRRAAMHGRRGFGPNATVMIAGVQPRPGAQWLVARVRSPDAMRELLVPLIVQTVIIYAVIVTVLALVMRRITRPLAALTGRITKFGQTRDAGGRLDPQGPDDIRRLIEAHNAMEARIINLLDEKDVMLGAIGHDLKTPLAALRVRIESVSDENERAKMAATIEDIVRSLDDILSLARVGRPGDAPERVELSALLASIVEEYEDLGKPVTLAQTSRMVIELRPTWLRRALRNLIDNALRYGEEARVSLTGDASWLRIAVEDRGPGIPAADIDRMMDPFTRGDPSRNKGTGGAGLGLALARAVAEQHGGTLVLANRPEGGLRAEMALPL